MHRQPAQMSTLAAACASPLHSASCAVDKSINRRAYASVYVRIRPYQNNASALGDLGTLSWLAGMPALVCAGLESSTSLNFVGDSRRMRAYALGATGDRSINSCADSRRMRAYTRVYAHMEYKPGLSVFLPWASCHIRKIAGAHAPGMPGTFFPATAGKRSRHASRHVPWCIPGSLTSGFLWRVGKTFPAFPAHAQPTIFRIW